MCPVKWYVLIITFKMIDTNLGKLTQQMLMHTFYTECTKVSYLTKAFDEAEFAFDKCKEIVFHYIG